MIWFNPTIALFSRGVADLPHLLAAGLILTCRVWLLLVAHVLPGCFSSLSNQPPFYSRDVSQMYDNILHKPLQIQGTKTVAACDIIQGLLHKDQKRRLGAKTDFVGSLSLITAVPWEKLSHTVSPFSLLQRTHGVDLNFQRERGGGQPRTPVCNWSLPSGDSWTRTLRY